MFYLLTRAAQYFGIYQLKFARTGPEISSIFCLVDKRTEREYARDLSCENFVVATTKIFWACYYVT